MPCFSMLPVSSVIARRLGSSGCSPAAAAALSSSSSYAALSKLTNATPLRTLTHHTRHQLQQSHRCSPSCSLHTSSSLLSAASKSDDSTRQSTPKADVKSAAKEGRKEATKDEQKSAHEKGDNAISHKSSAEGDKGRSKTDSVSDGEVSALVEKKRSESTMADRVYSHEGVISGLPEKYYTRKCILLQPAKSTMQSYADHQHWTIRFPVTSMWLNPLMGWTSCDDASDQVSDKMKFETLEDGIAYCKRQGFDYTIQTPHRRVKKKKAYADNFRFVPNNSGEAPRETVKPL